MSNSAISFNTAGLASTTSPGLVGTGAQTFAGKKTLDGGALIKGDTSGVAIASSYVGELNPNSQLAQRNGTNGFTFSGRSGTAYSSTLASILAITLNKGTYLISFSSVGGGTNTAAYWGMQGYFRIGGTQITSLISSSTYGPNSIGVPGLSLTIPVVITADSTVVDFYGQATSAGSYSTYNEIWAVRIA